MSRVFFLSLRSLLKIVTFLTIPLCRRSMIPQCAKKIGPVTWEIPTSFKEGMQVPARFYASDALLDTMDEKVIEQLTNVATLPGIKKAALCMPDGHMGYGFPIGGVAAFDPKEGGVISPGGIGFDINCLPGDTPILTEHGASVRIQDFMREMHDLPCLDLRLKKESRASPIRFLRRKAGRLFKITTAAGHELLATEDHPIWTGVMTEVSKVKEGDRVAVFPFHGVKFSRPSSRVLLNKQAVLERCMFNGSAVAFELEKRSLLPLRDNDPKFPLLVKLVAYSMGDGSLVCTAGKGFAWFWGKRHDLEDIRKDIIRVGFTPSKVYERKRNHRISTKYGEVRFQNVEYSMRVTSRSFVTLLNILGAPIGDKTRQPYLAPSWLFEAPLWHKRLFLASYFGAEMSAPSTLTGHGSSFYMPAVGLNKSPDALDSGYALLEQFKVLLADFGVSCAEISSEHDAYIGKKGRTSRLRLLIDQTSKNLQRLYGSIGYEYNQEKRILALRAAQYIRLKQARIRQRIAIQQQAIALREGGMQIAEIARTLPANTRFIQRAVYEGGPPPRIGEDFPAFEEFCKKDCQGSIVWDNVVSKEEVQHDDWVYDFTVDHKDHNFIASSFVVSNCGMRLVKTNLTVKEVEPKLKELVDQLFRTVPAGVGCKGFVKLKREDIKEVMLKGVKWCVDNGYGWKEDMDHIEESGWIKGGDPSKVSDRALARGIDQLGTLGSGNHYLEIQVVKKENINDQSLADQFGIGDDGQIVVMVHCGSRGFGHQIGTDYLKTFLDVMPRYNIRIIDRELACAPFESEEGQDYFKAHICAANLAFANRQVILHRIREAFSNVFQKDPKELGMDLIYDVAHNIAKIEDHKIDGKTRPLIVHRKGATRCFGPSRSELSGLHKKTGQPVIVGGSMETGSYLCVGLDGSEETFCSTMHGSGRTMSRTQAKHLFRGERLQKDMAAHGIYVKAVSMPGLAEEAGKAYKDITSVVDCMEVAGVSKKVVQLKPIGNVKG